MDSKSAYKALAATIWLIAPPVSAQSAPECSSNLHVASGLDDPFTANALYSRSNFFGLDCGPLSLQLDANDELWEGEDFFAASYRFEAEGWELAPRLRVSADQIDAEPVRELAFLAHRRSLSLLVQRSLNDRATKLGGWYTDIPVGSLGLDLLAMAELDEEGRGSLEVAAGVHSRQLGFWAGYTDLDRSLVLAYAANTGTAGLFGYTSLDTPTGEGIAMVRFGFERDGELGGCYDLSWGLPTIRALQDVPPFMGNDGGLFQGGDWSIELGWVRNEDHSFTQALAGRRLVRWSKGQLSAAIGPRYHDTRGSWDAIYEVRVDQSVTGRDLYLMLRGPGATATAGITIGF